MRGGLGSPASYLMLRLSYSCGAYWKHKFVRGQTHFVAVYALWGDSMVHGKTVTDKKTIAIIFS